MTVEIDDWTCRLDFSDGWVDVTAGTGLDSEGKAAWAREVVQSFNPLDLVASKESIEKNLIHLARSAEKNQAVLAAAFFALGGAHYATFDVQIFGEDGAALSLDEVENRLRGHKEIAGEPQVSRVDLPAGAAVRLQAMYQSKGVLGFGKRLSEAVSYALLVPETSDVLLATMNWSAMEHSDQLIEEVDALIPTLRFVPLDADGNPISEGGQP
ncbi:hypothetical protein [Streptomyces violaceus]|uniref:Uncharacterized protein n=1 Tax=Streptomyces violaceus TaxID=1936 RepID=A0ABY9U7Z0_STRVL|nr:hypothetical protein [Streptomyces janthinus]WND18973.1 hypothetical protein RI060_17190 [Streptomyces janthinus]GGS88886.1 hypothetical protein GCM10010270_71280 [Streptomyces janthinus]